MKLLVDNISTYIDSAESIDRISKKLKKPIDNLYDCSQALKNMSYLFDYDASPSINVLNCEDQDQAASLFQQVKFFSSSRTIDKKRLVESIDEIYRQFYYVLADIRNEYPGIVTAKELREILSRK